MESTPANPSPTVKPRTLAVLQSNYIPWKGYFDIIHDADLFIFYDDVDFTKNDWRNRNIIKTPNGPLWLTIPAGLPAGRRICDVELTDKKWPTKHWRSIQQYYSRTPFFSQYRAFFEYVYLERQWPSLSELNQFLITTISRDFLGITTRFADSRSYSLHGQKLDRLIDLVQQVGCQVYVSGPGSKSYIDESRFAQLNVELVWKDYSGYPEYPQPFPPFVHNVSILDLLFNTGPSTPQYIWGEHRRRECK